MTALQALAIHEAAVLECKQRNVNTSKVAEALDVLELRIHPTWLVPQYRQALDRHVDHEYDREGQQQVLRPTFEGIHESVKDLLGKQMDALAVNARWAALSLSWEPMQSLEF
jgi:hypothetical protein